MPAKVTLFDLKCEPLFDFGTGPRNEVFYNPHGNNILIVKIVFLQFKYVHVYYTGGGALCNLGGGGGGATTVPKILDMFSYLDQQLFFCSSNFLFSEHYLDWRLPKILQWLFKGHANVSDYFRAFLKINEVSWRLPRKFQRYLNSLTRQKNHKTNQFYAALTIFLAPNFLLGGGLQPPSPLMSSMPCWLLCDWVC